MKRWDVDWAPSLNLGHDKVNLNALQAASDRATRTEMRRRRVEEDAINIQYYYMASGVL